MIFLSDNLDEDSKYEAKVEARNEFGWSNQSEIFKFFTRNKGKPSMKKIYNLTYFICFR